MRPCNLCRGWLLVAALPCLTAVLRQAYSLTALYIFKKKAGLIFAFPDILIIFAYSII